MLGRRSHGEKASNGKPVKKLIKTANEEIAVLGGAHNSQKHLGRGAFFVSFSPFREPARR